MLAIVVFIVEWTIWFLAVLLGLYMFFMWWHVIKLVASIAAVLLLAYIVVIAAFQG